MIGSRLHHPVVATSPSQVRIPDGLPCDSGPPDARHDGHVPPGGLRAVIGRAGPHITVISLVGDIDLATADVLATAVTGAADADPDGRLVLELNRVSFLGARGLAVIAAAHRHAHRCGGDLILVVDQVAPAAVALRFLTPDQGPAVHATLTGALVAPLRPVEGRNGDGTGP